MYSFIYNYLVIPFFYLVLPVLGLFVPKIRVALRNQKGSIKRIRDQLLKFRSKKRIFWFHVSSAGEFLQAGPVIEWIKEQSPDIRVVITFLSPSGASWAKEYPFGDIVDYYPMDTKKNISSLIDAISPEAIVLVKFDIWPNLIWEAKHNRIPVFLISATLREKSLRITVPFVRNFYRTLYQKIDYILPVTDDDKLRFMRTNADHHCIEKMGDTRVDSVLSRQAKYISDPLPSHLELLRNRYEFIMIVGSAWPPDDKIVLPEWRSLEEETNDVKTLLIYAPHEPHSERLKGLSELLDITGLTHLLFSELEKRSSNYAPSVLIVDKVGILADLYRIGDVAFVGAGTGGVHNVMEPAAWSLPICFGPRYHNAPEAIALVNQGIARTFEDARSFADYAKDLLSNPEKRKNIGFKSRLYLDSARGASKNVGSLILREAGL